MDDLVEALAVVWAGCNVGVPEFMVVGFDFPEIFRVLLGGVKWLFCGWLSIPWQQLLVERGLHSTALEKEEFLQIAESGTGFVHGDGEVRGSALYDISREKGGDGVMFLTHLQGSFDSLAIRCSHTK